MKVLPAPESWIVLVELHAVSERSAVAAARIAFVLGLTLRSPEPSRFGMSRLADMRRYTGRLAVSLEFGTASARRLGYRRHRSLKIFIPEKYVCAVNPENRRTAPLSVGAHPFRDRAYGNARRTGGDPRLRVVVPGERRDVQMQPGGVADEFLEEH